MKAVLKPWPWSCASQETLCLERTIKELWLLQRWSGNEARILYQKQLLSYYKMQCEIFALMKNSKTGEAIKKLREIVKFEKDIAMKALKD